MDIKASLLSEIEKQKKSIATHLSGPRKYIKRGDLEKEREKKYLEEQEELERKRDEKLKEKLEKVKSQRSNNDLLAEKESQKLEEVSQSEIDEFFKKHDVPLHLEGETNEERTKRYEAFKEEKAVEKSKQIAAENKEHKGNEIERKVEELKVIGKTAMETDPINPALVLTEPEKTKALIIVFFTRLLEEWRADMEERSEEEKRSKDGRKATDVLKQTHEFMKPFFSLFKNPKQLQDDVAQSIAEMCHYMQHKDYVKANDAYLRLAIGNAPWPIGVTGVGIHERSSRERIGANQIARK